MSIKNWINEHYSAQTAGLKSETPTVPLPSTKTDLVTTKRMLNEYGALVNIGIKPMPWPANLLQSRIRWSSPSTIKTPHFLALTATLLKDMNYINGLIQEYGEKREK